MKQQFVVAHTMRQTELLALPDSWVTNKTCQNVAPTKPCLSSHFLIKRNMLKSWYIQDLSSSLLSPVKLCVGGLRQVGRGTWHRDLRTVSGLFVMGVGSYHKPSYIEFLV
jgi:hypothetical protein